MSETYIRRLAVLTPLTGLACAVVYSFTAWTPIFPDGSRNLYPWKSVIHAMVTFIAISGASFLGAGLLGFLFGFPRTPNTPEGASAVKSRYQHNKNIEQISDWVIKMLIGIGLSQLYDFPRLLWYYAKRLTAGVSTLGSQDGGPAATAVCLILFFLVCGFIEGYLVTRLMLPSRLVAADNISSDLHPAAEGHAETPAR